MDHVSSDGCRVDAIGPIRLRAGIVPSFRRRLVEETIGVLCEGNLAAGCGERNRTGDWRLIGPASNPLVTLRYGQGASRLPGTTGRPLGRSSQAVGRAQGVLSCTRALIIHESRIAPIPDSLRLKYLRRSSQSGIDVPAKADDATSHSLIVCSPLGEAGSESALAALEQGTVAIITQPRLGSREFFQDSCILLRDVVKSAAQARVTRRSAAVVLDRGGRSIIQNGHFRVTVK